MTFPHSCDLTEILHSEIPRKFVVIPTFFFMVSICHEMWTPQIIKMFARICFFQHIQWNVLLCPLRFFNLDIIYFYLLWECNIEITSLINWVALGWHQIRSNRMCILEGCIFSELCLKERTVVKWLHLLFTREEWVDVYQSLPFLNPF